MLDGLISFFEVSKRVCDGLESIKKLIASDDLRRDIAMLDGRVSMLTEILVQIATHLSRIDVESRGHEDRHLVDCIGSFVKLAAHDAGTDEKVEKRVVDDADQRHQGENRDTDETEYRLAEIAPGAFVYVSGPGKQHVEKGPWLCARCFLGGRQSILQLLKRDGVDMVYACPRCSSEIRILGQMPDIPAVVL